MKSCWAIYGDTLGIKDAKNKTNGFVPHDGHWGKKFHYMLANPPFGVEWKPEEDCVREEYAQQGLVGRFGAGFPEMKGFSRANLMYMRSFAEAWPDQQMVQQAVGPLPWGYHLMLLWPRAI